MTETPEEYCKEQIMDGYHSRRCLRKPVKDGYCKQHHPEEVQKRRIERYKRYREKMENRHE